MAQDFREGNNVLKEHKTVKNKVIEEVDKRPYHFFPFLGSDAAER